MSNVWQSRRCSTKSPCLAGAVRRCAHQWCPVRPAGRAVGHRVPAQGCIGSDRRRRGGPTLQRWPHCCGGARELALAAAPRWSAACYSIRCGLPSCAGARSRAWLGTAGPSRHARVRHTPCGECAQHKKPRERDLCVAGIVRLSHQATDAVLSAVVIVVAVYGFLSVFICGRPSSAAHENLHLLGSLR